MSIFHRLAAAVRRAPENGGRTLEEFLEPLLDRELDELAALPGTPGMVLAAQFLHYARQHGELAEVLRRRDEESDRLTEIVRRLRPRRRRPAKPRREEHHDADHSRTQTGQA